MRKRWNKAITILAAGFLFQLAGTCLPKNYLALTIRQISVSLANAAVNSTISNIADSLGLTVPVGNGGNTVATTDPAIMP